MSGAALVPIEDVMEVPKMWPRCSALGASGSLLISLVACSNVAVPELDAGDADGGSGDATLVLEDAGSVIDVGVFFDWWATHRGR